MFTPRRKEAINKRDKRNSSEIKLLHVTFSESLSPRYDCGQPEDMTKLYVLACLYMVQTCLYMCIQVHELMNVYVHVMYMYMM